MFEAAFRLISNCGPVARKGEPVVIGIPCVRGSFNDGQPLELFRSDGRRIQPDVALLDRWKDKSARWALIAFRAQTDQREEEFGFRLTSDGERDHSTDNDTIVKAVEHSGGYTIDTGPAVFTLSAGGKWPLRQVHRSDGSPWLQEPDCGLVVTMRDGSRPAHSVEEIAIELRGRIRTVARARGKVYLPSGRRIEIDWRLEFFGGLPIVIVHNTIRNPHRAKHPGGYWELGDAGSLLIREAAFELAVADPLDSAGVCFSPEPSKGFCAVGNPFELYQDSSGGENYGSHNHINREGRIPIAFRGYRIGNSSAPAGFRATPVVGLQTACGPLSLAVRHFWQNFPKAIETSKSGISFGLFPRQWSDLHELQGGEQKTHTFALSFGPDRVTDVPLDWFRQPLLPSINPQWVAHTQAITYLTPADKDPHRTYIELVDSAIEGEDTFEKKRETIDEYGWRSFGDIYADHEAIHADEYQKPDPLVSHYNNQYDAIAGFCYQWLRSGDCRWWTQFNELAAHVVDIDIYHTNEDKPAYNHGLFWHTFHYVDAGRSTHRSYPHMGKSNGGGPSNEHVYTTGLMLHYFLTGNPMSRDIAVGLAKFILDMDDGQKTIFKWLARGETGLASASRSPDYHGPGRGSANAVNALVDAHRITSEAVFLEKAEQLIRRVCSPDQNINDLHLLDAENRWFYTMFLQSLGKYLDHKRERGTPDEMYEYGRQTLMHFARWMARHEYPYLQKPEILEYPTETWSAQDIRKSEVFCYAFLHAADDERNSLMERSAYFFSHALRSLSAAETKSLSRPVVLLLSLGWMHARFANIDRLIFLKEHTDATGAPSETGVHLLKEARPRVFEPQKKCALRRIKVILLVLMSVMLSLFLWRTLIC